MPHDSRLERFELFAATACIGAHAQSDNEGFRLRDVKFLVELFSNWAQNAFEGDILPIQNTQVGRYIQQLVKEGFARQLSRKGPPRFRLTRVGLLELINKVGARSYAHSPPQFFFLFYFFRNYNERIQKLIEEEGTQFPPALRIEIESALNLERLLNRELEVARRERRKLEARIHDAEATSSLVQAGVGKGESLATVVKQAQKLYPYELNSQKPLTELIQSIPEEYRLWELQTGNLHRSRDIWRPVSRILDSYVEELEALHQEFFRGTKRRSD